MEENVSRVVRVVTKSRAEQGDSTIQTALMYASTHGLTDTVKRLLDSGAEARSVDKLNRTSLILALENMHVKTAEVLLGPTKAADALDVFGAVSYGSSATEYTETALMLAAQKGWAQVVEKLISAGSKIELVNKDNRTSLMLSCEEGHAEVALKLVMPTAAAGSLDVRDMCGRTCLMIASERGLENVVKVLLDAGASPGLTDNMQITSLLYSIVGLSSYLSEIRWEYEEEDNGGCNCSSGDRDSVGDTLSNCHSESSTGEGSWYDFTIEDETKEKWSEKNLECIQGRRRVSESLIMPTKNAGAIDLKDKNGRSALMMASLYGRKTLVVSLLGANAQVDLTDNRELDSLMLAAKEGHVLVVEILLASGANSDHTDARGRTSLMRAARNAHASVVEALLAADCDRNKVDKVGRSALHYAAAQGDLNTARALVKAGCKTDTRDKQGRSALHYAAKKRHVSMVRMLLEAGAKVWLKDKQDESVVDVLWAAGAKITRHCPEHDETLCKVDGKPISEHLAQSIAGLDQQINVKTDWFREGGKTRCNVSTSWCPRFQSLTRCADTEWEYDVDRMRVVLVCMDSDISSDSKAMQKFRAAVQAGSVIIPIICPGYQISDYSRWWPATMPEMEKHTLFFDSRGMFKSIKLSTILPIPISEFTISQQKAFEMSVAAAVGASSSKVSVTSITVVPFMEILYAVGRSACEDLCKQFAAGSMVRVVTPIEHSSSLVPDLKSKITATLRERGLPDVVHLEILHEYDEGWRTKVEFELLSQVKKFLDEWRGQCPDPSAFAAAADRIMCIKCSEESSLEPYMFSRLKCEKDLGRKRAQMNEVSAQASDNGSWVLNAADAQMITCGNGHILSIQDVLSKSVIMQAVPCPNCVQSRDMPPFCFNRHECLLYFSEEAQSSNRSGAVSCPYCAEAGRGYMIRVLDIVAPEVFLRCIQKLLLTPEPYAFPLLSLHGLCLIQSRHDYAKCLDFLQQLQLGILAKAR